MRAGIDNVWLGGWNVYEEEEAQSETEMKNVLGNGRMKIYLRGSPFNWAATSFLT